MGINEAIVELLSWDDPNFVLLPKVEGSRKWDLRTSKMMLLTIYDR